jgi:peptidoglycan/LPS O-acetylase OafA/YrhL
MKRVSVASLLLLLGGVLLAAALPMKWTPAWRGVDYPGYDIVTTLLLTLLLFLAALAVAARRRWATSFSVTSALLASFWGVLVVLAAAYPASGSNQSANTGSIGIGAWVVLAGAVVALFGSLVSFRDRRAAAIRLGAASGV